MTPLVLYRYFPRVLPASKVDVSEVQYYHDPFHYIQSK